jgi:hypothetical protein
MQLNRIKFDSVRFPGRAGEHQAAGDVRALVGELGDNYDVYHEHLRGEMAQRLGRGRPEPKDFSDGEDYFRAYERLEDVVKAEAFLRTCVAHRRDGAPIDSPPDARVPLVDERDRLVRMR